MFENGEKKKMELKQRIYEINSYNFNNINKFTGQSWGTTPKNSKSNCLVLIKPSLFLRTIKS